MVNLHADVSRETDEPWKETLPELLKGYPKENIWNLEETICFLGKGDGNTKVNSG